MTRGLADSREFQWDVVMEIIDDMEPVERLKWRHGWRDRYVFEVDGHHWRVEILKHPEDGWRKLDPILAMRVVATQKTVTEWVPA